MEGIENRLQYKLRKISLQGSEKVVSELELVSDLESDLENALKHVKPAKRGRGNPGRKDKKKYLDIITCFDIETSKDILPEMDNSYHAWVYMWQFALGLNTVYIGRSLDDYKKFITVLGNLIKTGYSIVIYVHNLSYEFQFISGIWNFANEDVFCTAPHKILKAVHGSIEYRCSMLHSNMSLERWTKQMDVEHQKLSGDEFDYSEIRYPWTPLTDYQLSYGINDVLGVVECINTELIRDGDNLYTIPLTSTGYVRRDVKRSMQRISYVLMQKLHMDKDLYFMFKRAFRGGDTHANRYFSNRIIENVQSYDRSSSYPDVMLNCKFPMSRFIPDPYVKTLDDVIVDIYQRGRACIADVAFFNYKQADRFNGFPYISHSKCWNVSKDTVLDNGRILESKYFEMTLTDIDFKIIIKETSPDTVMLIRNYRSARYGYLPDEFKTVILDYYKRKTELKNISGKEYYYNKSKNKLNASFGLSVQDPCKDNILFDDGEYNDEGIEIEELLDKYYKRAFISYAWGVWVTAWARLELRKALWLVGRDGIYTDTDSVKFIGDHDFSELNNEYKSRSEKNNAYAAEKTGKVHYMGVYEYEGTYKRFATLGAKKYAYEDETGKLHITIAGVNKVKGAQELAENGGLERFILGTTNEIGTGEHVINDKGFIFRKGGGNELIYNMERFYADITRDGHTLPITRNVVIKDSTYQLGIGRDYKIILEGIVENYLEEYEYL